MKVSLTLLPFSTDRSPPYQELVQQTSLQWIHTLAQQELADLATYVLPIVLIERVVTAPTCTASSVASLFIPNDNDILYDFAIQTLIPRTGLYRCTLWCIAS